MYTGDQPIGRQEGVLTNGKKSAEALRPGPTYHCLPPASCETGEITETIENSETSVSEHSGGNCRAEQPA